MNENVKRDYETVKFKLRLCGLSRDQRTNSWECTCKACGKSYKPATTMLAGQTITCPKCNESEYVNYNELK
jgi:hypothetical protein